MRSLVLALLVVLLGCEQERAVTPTPDEDPPPPATEDPAPEASASEAAGGTTPRMARVVDLPEGTIELPTLPTGTAPFDEVIYGSPTMEEHNHYPTVEHPDPAVNTMLASRLPALTRGFLEGAQRAGGSSSVSDVAGRCELALAHPRLLSVACRGWVIWNRGYPTAVWRTHSFSIEDGALREHGVRASLLPQTELAPTIRTLCERETRSDAHDVPRNEACADAPARAALAFARTGLRVLLHARSFRMETTTRMTIPWADLDRRVLADSPVGRELAALDGAEVVEVPRPVEPAGELTEGFALTPMAALGETLAAWSRLGAEARADVSVHVSGDRDRAYTSLVDRFELRSQLVIPGADARASELARTLGTEATATSWRASARPFVGRLNREATLRDAPFGEPRLSLPAGALVRGLLGSVGTRESAIGQRRTWAWVAASERVEGFLAGNLVEEHDGCAPDASSFLTGIPEGAREAARASMMTVLTEVAHRGRRVPVVSWVATTRTGNRRRSGRSRMEIVERGADCAMGARLLRADLDGEYFALGFAHDAPNGGEALIVLATKGVVERRRRRQWHVMRLRQPEPVATRDTRIVWSVPSLGRWRGDELVLVESEDERLVWRDDALIASPAGD